MKRRQKKYRGVRMATNRVQTGLRLEEEILAKITFIAKKQKRSLNAQVEFAVQECIEEYENKHGEIMIKKE
jgi:hypothetical protein